MAIADMCPCVVLYVSTEGNDNWSGRLPEPNALMSDGPFATLERARQEIRQIKSGYLSKGPIVVELRKGDYWRSSAFELTSDDSGSDDNPIIYRARNGEVVRIIGGKKVANFELVSDASSLERLSPEARGKVFRADLKLLGIFDYGQAGGGGIELFFNGKPMTLARWPNEGFVKIVGLVGGDPVDVRGTKGDKIGKFIYEGDRPRRWLNENDIWVHGYWFWDWSDQRHKVESIDTENRVISVLPPYHGYGYRVGQWFYAFNILSELDVPGEWYIDRSEGMLYFWPPSPFEGSETIVSVADKLLTVKDVQNVSFEGLTFEVARGTALSIKDSKDVRIVNCTVRNVAGWAVDISGGERNKVLGCDIYELGSGGISISGGDRTTLTSAGHCAENNHIYNYGRWNRMYQPAISIGGVGNVARNNLIHDAPHIAIYFEGNDHIIEFNEIYNVCYESNDAGAIYAGRDWTMRGTMIRYNYLHDISGFEGRGCVGVYLDDMFCGTTIFGNIFYKVTSAAFIGGGRDNIIQNNLFVDCIPSIHVDARAMNWASYHVNTTMTERLLKMPYKGPLWASRYPQLVNILDDDPAAPKGNVIAKNISLGGRWDDIYDEARPYVILKDNLVDQDPGFVEAPPESFEMRDDSIAYKIGFQRIPIEKIGLRR